MVHFCKEHGDRITIILQVQPRARKTAIVGLYGEALKVKLAAPPVDGAANDELVRFFAEFLDMPRSAIRVLQGEKARRKVIEVDGMATSDFTQILLKHGLLTIKLG